MDTKKDSELEIAHDKIQELEKKITLLERRLEFYERPSGRILYYSLIRKQNEMAELLNATSLKDAIAEADKVFERTRFLYNDAKDLVLDTKILGEAMGITGDEEKDTTKNSAFMDQHAS